MISCMEGGRVEVGVGSEEGKGGGGGVRVRSGQGLKDVFKRPTTIN